ncbi:MAG: serine protease, partial [Ignavibacteria bacterium]
MPPAPTSRPQADPLPEPWTPAAYVPTPRAKRSGVGFGLVGLMLVSAVVAGSLAGYLAGSRAPHEVSGLVASNDLPKGNVTVAESLAMIDAVKKVGPATVTIRATEGATAGASGASGPISGALGTGIIFDSDGHILTNDHVVANG